MVRTLRQAHALPAAKRRRRARRGRFSGGDVPRADDAKRPSFAWRAPGTWCSLRQGVGEGEGVEGRSGTLRRGRGDSPKVEKWDKKMEG